MQQFPADRPDDLDRLMAHLEPVAPPPDFLERVLLRTAALPQHSPRHIWLMGAGYILALGLLGVMAFDVGQNLSLNGALDLIVAMLSDPDLALLAPLDYLFGILEAVPWLQVAAAVLLASAALLVVRALDRTWSRREDFGWR